jgi:hypothetical protein
MENWKLALLFLLKDHAHQLTPEQQFLLTLRFMYARAKKDARGRDDKR